MKQRSHRLSTISRISMIGKALFVASILMASSNQALAWATGCASCEFPEEKAESARVLEEQIRSADHDHLRRLLFVGEVCAANGFDCGNLTEQEAGRLVEHHFEATRVRWDTLQKVALGFVAFAGLGLGLANRYRPRA